MNDTTRPTFTPCQLNLTPHQTITVGLDAGICVMCHTPPTDWLPIYAGPTITDSAPNAQGGITWGIFFQGTRWKAVWITEPVHAVALHNQDSMESREFWARPGALQSHAADWNAFLTPEQGEEQAKRLAIAALVGIYHQRPFPLQSNVWIRDAQGNVFPTPFRSQDEAEALVRFVLDGAGLVCNTASRTHMAKNWRGRHASTTEFQPAEFFQTGSLFVTDRNPLDTTQEDDLA